MFIERQFHLSLIFLPIPDQGKTGTSLETLRAAWMAGGVGVTGESLHISNEELHSGKKSLLFENAGFYREGIKEAQFQNWYTDYLKLNSLEELVCFCLHA